MTKKKPGNGGKTKNAVSETEISSASTKQMQSAQAPISGEAKAVEPSTSALIICRNKHWRYISCFHGPWLQLPPEILESLAYSNYNAPRPRPIDPAVFFDMVKIRRLIDEATDLSVRAATGTASGGSLNSNNGFQGSAAALGFGGSSGANIKLSRERKHRMREHATQKLAQAYCLDEVAASVATMQGTSSLEEVASHVIQRNSENCHAKYVHFFHEKIPSRMLAQCTSLQALDEIIRNQPTEAAPLRTRAVTKLFMEDYQGALTDLTQALRIYRSVAPLHGIRSRPADSSTVVEGVRKGHRRQEPDLAAIRDEVERLSSMEPQLLFHRAGVYLTLACQSVHTALDSDTGEASPMESSLNGSEASLEAEQRRLEFQRLVKTNAKRALRDYLEFLSHFEYTALSTLESYSEVPKRRAIGLPTESSSNSSEEEPAESKGKQDHVNSDSSIVKDLVQAEGQGRPPGNVGASPSKTDFLLRTTKLYPASVLFCSSPPTDIPPYPSAENALITRQAAARQRENEMHYSALEQDEIMTYHPLLIDALHSVLLCHSLIQSPPKQILRHAHMVARLARICDGYPIFLAARSPSRSDWLQIVQKTKNWIGLTQSWESLCTPPVLPQQDGAPKHEKTPEQVREQRRHEAIMEALADERVHDEASFQAAVQANTREEDGMLDREPSAINEEDQRWAQEYAKEHPSTSGRADAVARWVREAPQVATGGSKSKRGTKGRMRKNVAEKSSRRTSDCSDRPAIESLTVTNETSVRTEELTP